VTSDNYSKSLTSQVTATFNANEHLEELVNHLKTLITGADVAETRDVSEQHNKRAAALGDSIPSSVPF